jgi:hypothetical protein
MGWPGLAARLPLSALAKLQALDEKKEKKKTPGRFKRGQKRFKPLLENGFPAALAELQVQGRTATERLYGTRPRTASFRERQTSGRDGIKREDTCGYRLYVLYELLPSSFSIPFVSYSASSD